MKYRQTDKIFLLTVFILLVVGLFILVSASMGLLIREQGASFSKIVLKQIGLGLVEGVILMLVISKINYKFWKKIALPLFLFCFFLTFLVFVPHIGFEHGGAQRWISVGPFTFQPSEFLKFAFIVYLASWMAGRKNDIKSFKSGFLPFLIMIAFVAMILIKEPDIGTLGVIAIASAFMFLIGGGKYNQLALMIFLGLALLFVLITLKPYAMSRITVFMNPDFDPQGIGYQSKQSLIAIGSGGLFGRGLGMSIQKFDYLPQPVGDSIFAVFAEEFGFIGGIILIGLYLFFLYRGFKIALNANDAFARLLGSGLVAIIVIQSFINIGSMTGIIPLTGLPLIFISQGGTALVVALASCGVLLNISKKS